MSGSVMSAGDGVVGLDSRLISGAGRAMKDGVMKDVFARYAVVGDAVMCGVKHPYPHTLKLTLMTPEAAAYANNLLAREDSGWRLERKPQPDEVSACGRK